MANLQNGVRRLQIGVRRLQTIVFSWPCGAYHHSDILELLR